MATIERYCTEDQYDGIHRANEKRRKGPIKVEKEALTNLLMDHSNLSKLFEDLERNGVI